jgi:hypothetical protein
MIMSETSAAISGADCAQLTARLEEAGENSRRVENSATGAEAQSHLQQLNGTNEFVLFPNPARTLSFSAAPGVVPFPVAQSIELISAKWEAAPLLRMG